MSTRQPDIARPSEWLSGSLTDPSVQLKGPSGELYDPSTPPDIILVSPYFKAGLDKVRALSDCLRVTVLCSLQASAEDFRAPSYLGPDFDQPDIYIGPPATTRSYPVDIRPRYSTAAVDMQPDEPTRQRLNSLDKLIWRFEEFAAAKRYTVEDCSYIMHGGGLPQNGEDRFDALRRAEDDLKIADRAHLLAETIGQHALDWAQVADVGTIAAAVYDPQEHTPDSPLKVSACLGVYGGDVARKLGTMDVRAVTARVYPTDRSPEFMSRIMRLNGALESGTLTFSDTTPLAGYFI